MPWCWGTVARVVERSAVRRLRAVGRAIGHGYQRFAARLEAFIVYLERRYTPLGRFTPGPFEGWGFLWQPALLGALALTLVVAGCSFTNSPFKLNMHRTWFFGEPALNPVGNPSETKYLLSIVMVWGGLLLIMRVWLRLVEVMKIHGGAPVRQLWWVFALWVIPMVIAPPLFSRDVFSYAAQGEMTSHAISPYVYGPQTLGSSPYVNPVDPLWWNTPAPYGPLFLFLDGSMAKLTGHHQLATVVGLRILAALAAVMIGLGVTALARALGRDPGEALALSALNPLVLLTLVGGAHNDGLMAGLLVLGLAAAVRRRFVWAVVLCASAAAVKAPALYGLAFIAWTWRGPGAKWRERVRPVVGAGVITAATLSVWTLLAGFGFGWVGNLLSNGTVRSWAAPATGIGLGLSKIFNALGWGVSTTPVLSVTRFLGLTTALIYFAWLLWRGEHRGWVRSLGVALVLVVVLGPVVQPWYFGWGLVVLAACYQGREHFWLLALSIVGPFIGLPGGRELLAGLLHANPLLIALALATLGGVLVAPMGRWTQWSWPEQGLAELEP